MAKRDPDKTARNRIIAIIKDELRGILPRVLRDTGPASEQSLYAKIGSKRDDFFDLKHDVIHSQDEFVNRWMQGLISEIRKGYTSHSYRWIYGSLRSSRSFKKNLILFLNRSYLKHFEELSKNRPRPEDSEIWIGRQNVNYGLFVTPRFNRGRWENDKSEIRSFKEGYWTIGHIRKTGFVIPGRDSVFRFRDIDQYLL